jgi:hypothetical protein
MPRRWSCIALTTLYCLFALATSAFAECAWVLWSQYDPDQWSVEAAFSRTDGGQAACHRAIEDLIQRTAENPRATQAAERIHLRHTCLPDTVDPRGRRGSER